MEELVPPGLHLAVQDLANTVKSWPRWPYLDLAHFILVTVAIREDMPAAPNGARTSFPRRHPGATYLSCLLSGVSGALIVNAICGSPPGPAAPLTNNGAVLMATLVWYLIFYSPFDVAYRVIKISPVFTLVQVLKEFHRMVVIDAGVQRALSAYPTGYLVAVLCGTIGGAGSGVFRICDRLIRGVWRPDAHELLTPGFFTRMSAVVSAVLVTRQCAGGGLLPAELTYPVLYLAAVIIFLYCRVLNVLLGVGNPVRYAEDAVYTLLFGRWESVVGGEQQGTGKAAADAGSGGGKKPVVEENKKGNKSKFDDHSSSNNSPTSTRDKKKD